MVLAAVVTLGCRRGDASLPLALANDNRVPAGTLAGDTLRVNLVASMARFYPESDSGPFFTTAAFAEPGQAPLVPGPLIRLRVGTTLRAAVRNTLADTLLVVGLGGPALGATDTLRIPPNASDSVETLVRTPGTFAYYGHTRTGGKINPGGPGDQLFGAFVADTIATPNDRVFVIKDWTPDSVRFVLMFNGKSWPYTERLTLDVDDTLRVRLINGANSDHPMHLHGFYYTVNARGGWHADTVLAASERRLVVTETLRPKQTMALTWVPTRPGNWLLHCHDAFHINGTQHDYLAGRTAALKPSSHDAMEHLRQDMAGLVLGITVRGDATAIAPASTDRRMRLFVRERARSPSDSLAAYTYALDSDASPHVWPPATLTLTRGQRTAITVINRLAVPTGVHWHGIELESYYDGVAGWSGGGTRLAPLIAPNDSFVAVMTPPRAGTFIYHAHVDDELQIGLGLAAPLLVLEPGTRRDTTRDHVWLFTVAGITDSTPVVLNGAHPLAAFAAAVPHRIRIVSISPADVIKLELHDAAGVVRWRPVAKDGADLPANQSTERSARLTMGPGETWDLVWVPKRGRYSLKVDTFNKFEVPIEARE